MKVDKIFLPVFNALKKAVKEANEFNKNMEKWGKLDWSLDPMWGHPLSAGLENTEKKENEMNKCEWKDGKFYPCNNFDGKTTQGFITVPDDTEDDGERLDRVFNNCKSCHSDIRKPEPEQPIIKKSGGTWVILHNKIDYMVTDLAKYRGVKKIADYTVNDLISDQITRVVTPISEIEITDEIAKLRPMVLDGDSLEKLYAVDCGSAITDYDGINGGCIKDYRLATIKDLED